MTTPIPWPRAEVALSAEGRARINLGGVVSEFTSAEGLDAARQEVVAAVSERAAQLGRAVPTVITEPAGTWGVLIHPDGTVTADDHLVTASSPSRAAAETTFSVNATPAEHTASPAARPTNADLSSPFAAGENTAPSVPPSTEPALPPTVPPTVASVRQPADPELPPALAPGSAPSSAPATRPPAGPPTDPAPLEPPAEQQPTGQPLDLSTRTAPSGLPTLPPSTQPSAGAPDSAQPHAVPAVQPPADHPPTGQAPRQPEQPTTAPTREQARSTSLLTDITNEAPAVTGWRGALNGLGLHLAPSDKERAERADVAAVSQHWAGPRTIAVVNGKGGATKTPTTILLSAVFARHGGAGVVAYDNNSTRGTLGWRTQTGPHDATVIDLLPHVDHLLSPQAQAAEMSGFVHHQREDRYDVLRSRPEVLADEKPSDAASFDAVHAVLAKYYRLVIVDSGNDESTPQWRAMIHKADAIVVPTITRPEHAESARLLLSELSGADPHSASLAENALVIVSQGSKAEPGPDQLVETFRQITRAAVGIPYDPAMAGRPLILDSLAHATRRAWLAAGAALADGLH